MLWMNILTTTPHIFIPTYTIQHNPADADYHTQCQMRHSPLTCITTGWLNLCQTWVLSTTNAIELLRCGSTQRLNTRHESLTTKSARYFCSEFITRYSLAADLFKFKPKSPRPVQTIFDCWWINKKFNHNFQPIRVEWLILNKWTKKFQNRK